MALATLDARACSSSSRSEQQIIEQAVPGTEVRSLALPFGAMPANERSRHAAAGTASPTARTRVMLVGANPAPSPFSATFDPANVPRIRSAQKPWRGGQENYAFDYWIGQLGAPRTCPTATRRRSASRSRTQARLAERFRSKANPY